jgi:hypothetical protein
MRLAFAAHGLPLLLCACGAGELPPVVPAAETPPAAAFSGHLLVADSPQTLLAWAQAAPAAREGHAGLLEGVVYGQKAFVRAVVTDFSPNGQAEDLVAGWMRLRGPDGGVLHTEDVGGAAEDLEATAPGILFLRPGLDLLFDPGDPVGTYTIEADLGRGAQHVTLTRPLQVASGGDFLPRQGGAAP